MTKPVDVWIVDDDHAIRWVLEKALSQAEFSPRCFDSADRALAQLKREVPAAIVTDIRMPGMDGMQLMEAVQTLHSHVPVILMTAFADLDRAVAAFQGGAFEYLPKPFDVDEAVTIVRRAVSMAREAAAGHEPEPSGEIGMGSDIIGSAPAMQEVFRAIGRLSKSNMTVLLTGESGSGKELVARALHRHSPRANKPFIALNTAAIPRELLESELFGHERGAFTGATGQRTGRFEQANGGTLFLDEIGDMPAELQTRLLRVLAEGDFYRVGGHQPVHVNVRVIAATHQDLEKRVEAGVFREDLFHRLNVIRLHLPPLRERKEDIPELAGHFLRVTAQEVDIEPKRLSPAALAAFRTYSWPGNVRQMENVCRRLSVMAPGQLIEEADLPRELLENAPAGSATERTAGDDWELALRRWAEQHMHSSRVPILDEAMPRFERTMILFALAQTQGRRHDAARLLGWGRNTLTRKIKELAMEV
ncbi:MAG: nitrogen regulation protein NR(I) [Gammaproteobacteria bacterium]|nr:nitrogen regulation protein NR(I) [Gammaproteobacteria bacterium]